MTRWTKPVFRTLHSYLGLDSSNFPNAESAMKKAVSVPIYPALTDGQVRHICASIREVWSK